MAMTPEEYSGYVEALATDFPHLKPLRNFMQEMPSDRYQADKIAVFDVSTSGVVNKSEFRTIEVTRGIGPSPPLRAPLNLDGPSEARISDERASDETPSGSAALADKLNTTPEGLNARVITVSHLTPTTAKILGSRFDLSADFLNAHLPSPNEADLSASLTAGSSSTFHIGALETYCVDYPMAAPLFEDRRDSGFHDKQQFAIWHASLRACYMPFWFVPERSQKDVSRDIWWFLLQQKVSIHIASEANREIVIILHYPPPMLRKGLEEIVATKKRVETPVAPSQWRQLCAAGSMDSARLSDFGTHLSSLLETRLPGAQNVSDIAVQQVFAVLRFSLASTTSRLGQRVGDLGALYKLESEKREDERHGRNLLEVVETTQRLHVWVRDAVDLLDRVCRRNPPASGVAVAPRPNVAPTEGVGHSSSAAPSPTLSGSNQSHEEVQPIRQGLESATIVNAEWLFLNLQFRKAHDTIRRLTEQARRLSQTRLVYMQIAESRKAIEQADSVRRLTTLAFIFIPLTYVAGVFGAEITEMDGARSSRNFAISSAVTTVATILVALCLPAVVRLLDAWRVHVYTVLNDVDILETTFSVWKSILAWETYFWDSRHLESRNSKTWLKLPLATLDLGRLRLRQLWRAYMARKKKSEGRAEEEA